MTARETSPSSRLLKQVPLSHPPSPARQDAPLLMLRSRIVQTLNVPIETELR